MPPVPGRGEAEEAHGEGDVRTEAEVETVRL